MIANSASNTTSSTQGNLPHSQSHQKYTYRHFEERPFRGTNGSADEPTRRLRHVDVQQLASVKHATAKRDLVPIQDMLMKGVKESTFAKKSEIRNRQNSTSHFGSNNYMKTQ